MSTARLDEREQTDCLVRISTVICVNVFQQHRESGDFVNAHPLDEHVTIQQLRRRIAQSSTEGN